MFKTTKISYTHREVVNIYIVYELGASSSNDSDSTLKKLFIWCSYFNKKRRYWKISVFWLWNWIWWKRKFPGGGLGENVLIFGVDMSSSAHVDKFFCTRSAHISLRNRTNTRIRTYKLQKKCIPLILQLWIKNFV